MKKKLFALLLLCSSTFSWADEYPSLHGGAFLGTILNSTSFMNNNLASFNYSYSFVTRSALNVADNSAYYPNGWAKFKLYVPAGVDYAMINIATLPNATLRIHTKYRADVNNLMDHVTPQKIAYGYFPDDVSQLTAEGILTNTGQYFFANPQSGWVYFDVLNDNAVSYAEHQTYASSIQLVINYRLQKSTNSQAAFDNWLQTTYFLTPNGDPSALVPSMTVRDLPAPGAPIDRTVALDFGGALYNGTANSSYSSVSVSSVASSSVASSVDSSVSSTTNSVSSVASSTSQCPDGYYFNTTSGWCTQYGATSSVVSSVSSVASSVSQSCPDGYYFNTTSGWCTANGVTSSVSSCTSATSGGGSILPQAICPTSSSSSSSSSKASSSSSSSKASSSSSSSKASDANLTSKSLTLQPSWNLISLPLETNDVVDVNKTLNGKATIGWKFKFISDVNASYAWEKWLPGTAMTLSNGEGLFVGVPTSYGTQTIDFNVTKDSNITKFSEMSFITGKWYLLGFSYDLSMSSIKSDLNASFVAWIQENGAYKKLDENATINAGQGFWFKKK